MKLKQTLVVHDPRDQRKDYQLPEQLAARLYAIGRLALIETGIDRWDYFDRGVKVRVH